MNFTDWITAALLMTGLFFIAAGVVGILRMPDFYTRLHAQGKCDTLGVSLMLGALALHQGFTLTSLKIVAILFFIVLANPVATHALGRAALSWGLRPWTKKNGE